MKKLIILLFALLTSASMLFAESGTCGDNLTWNFSNGVLTISGTGAMTDYSNSSGVPWYSLRSSIQSVIFSNNITSIGNYAFYNCSGLTSITIPNNVTSIGNYAFYNCSGLTSITIHNNVTSIGSKAFYYCSGLTSITIPDKVTSIGEYAFYHCSELTLVTIGKGVVSIGSEAFSYCFKISSIVWNATNYPNPSTYTDAPFYFMSSVAIVTFGNEVKSIPDYFCDNMIGLTTVSIPNSVKSIGKCAFSGCEKLTSITIPNSVISIGNSAFSNCTGLTSVTIPNNVTSIGSSAFNNCSRLTSLEIPNSVTSIGSYAFNGCSGLTSIEIPNSVTSIGSHTFSTCYGLTSITIPNNVTSIGSYAFFNCYGLTSITIPNNVTSIGERAFCGCFGVITLVVPNSVTSIGSYAFEYVPNIVYTGIAAGTPWGARSVNGYVDGWLVFDDNKKMNLLACSSSAAGSIEIPNSVTNIENNAFYYCKGLTKVSIPNSVTRIGEKAFYNCSGLTSITIPNNVTSIGSEAFYYCSGLGSVTNCSVTPQFITLFGTGVNKSTCTLYVRKNSIDLYRSAQGWKDFKNISSIRWNVSFLDYDDSILSEQDVEDGDAAIAPTNPTREGYTFTGWDKDYSNITSDLAITAQYKLNLYEVKFLDWDGTILKIDSCGENSSAAAPADPHRVGYTFTGWDKEFASITSDLVVTAQYVLGEDINFTIYFNDQDGDEILSNAVVLKVPAAPEIEGFTFLGWKPVASFITDAIDIQAVYQSNTPTEAPEVVANPANPAQKLIRNGNVYILTGDKTYTITGQKVR